MAHEPIPPYPKNAPGPFYVQSECCIACSAPEQEAPDLMDHGEWPDGEEGYHCYFKRQPETPDEVERAISACVVSCVRAVRYAGNNPKILKRFRELRNKQPRPEAGVLGRPPRGGQSRGVAPFGGGDISGPCPCDS
jgi:hypothetical protein